MNRNKIPVIVIFAPTATGKTALTVKLFGTGSLFFEGKAEIISADSMAVYKHMDIGTAKPDHKLQKEIPHHMIDLLEPDRQFDVSSFVEKGDVIAKEIFERKKIPVVAGGTGFYIRNFILGLPQTPESNPEIRESLKAELEKSGIGFMYEKLKVVDPVSAEKINANDAYRILRALEVFYITGKTRSEFVLPQKSRGQYDFLTIVLERDREDLYRRIDLRVEQMFENGLESEVEMLLQKGYGKESPGMQAIGYREFFMGLNSVSEIKEKIKHDSHKYAKKQYVFMKGIPDCKKFFIPEKLEYTDEIFDEIKNWIEKIN